MSDRISEIKYRRNKKKVIEAYELYRADPGGNESKFFETVRAFARVKLYYLEMEFSLVGTANTVDDYAQEVTIAVWSDLHNFKGDSRQFYSWLHSICFKKAADFFNELKDQKLKKEPLTYTAEDKTFDEGGAAFEEEVDNPLLYESEIRDSFITIPEGIQGTDRDICKLLTKTTQVDGNGDEEKPSKRRNTVDYEYIGRMLGLTPNAVEHRVRRIRETQKKEREEQKKRMALRDAQLRPTKE